MLQARFKVRLLPQIRITKCNLFFHHHDAKKNFLFSQHKILCKTQICLHSSFFFTLKFSTLDSPAVRITCEFNLYYWDHVCKVNEWCLVDCFHRKLRVFPPATGFQWPFGPFFLWFKIFTLIPTLLPALICSAAASNWYLIY